MIAELVFSAVLGALVLVVAFFCLGVVLFFVGRALRGGVRGLPWFVAFVALLWAVGRAVLAL